MQRRASRDEELAFLRLHEISASSRWHLIDGSWLRKWRHYALRRGQRPGPISNENLLQADGITAKRGLRERDDYRGVSQEVWDYFVAQHGGGPCIVSPQLDVYHPGVVVTYASQRLADGAGPSKARAASQRRSKPSLVERRSSCDKVNEDEERACVICLDAARTTRLLPCSHCILCTACADSLLGQRGRGKKKPCCPTCRQECKGFEEINFVQTFHPKPQRLTLNN
mmetsp:Transcript_27225/g.62779  ORF Transcript_27225/g.62779 Transcript_27225/m.62779 type:complete len:226 (+) Transcript_27225:76-753(+)